MEYRKGLLFSLLVLLSMNVCGQVKDSIFNRIYNLIEQKDFFKAKAMYYSQKNNISTLYQSVIEVFVDNAFNRLEDSNSKIDRLLKSKNNLNDSLLFQLYKIKEDNSIKLFDYKGAKNAVNTILTDYNSLLSEGERTDNENSFKLWSALDSKPKQTVVIKETSTMKMERDKQGLNTLEVSAGKDTVNFIFDTGANLSITSEVIAKRLNMEIIPVDIEVGTITGENVAANIAICPELKLGNIEVYNAVFLVLEGEGLYFPQIDYHINGILGFPIIEAMREIHITQDGCFIVPKDQTPIRNESNMAMNGLTPLICIDQRHFTFDTGADRTMFFNSYYIENKEEIDKNYLPTKIRFGGAAGEKEFDGYVIEHTFNVLDKRVTLKGISLLKDDIKNLETIYGNIGQDLIKQFNKMILNFDHMFIQFD